MLSRAIECTAYLQIGDYGFIVFRHAVHRMCRDMGNAQRCAWPRFFSRSRLGRGLDGVLTFWPFIIVVHAETLQAAIRERMQQPKICIITLRRVSYTSFRCTPDAGHIPYIPQPPGLLDVGDACNRHFICDTLSHLRYNIFDLSCFII